MTETFTHSDRDQLSLVTSYLTGNQITINLAPHQFYVSPEKWKSVVDVAASAKALYSKIPRLDKRWTTTCEEMLCQLADAKDLKQFCLMIDAIFHNKESRWFILETGEVRKNARFRQAGFHRWDKQFIRSFFLELWKRQAILFPLVFPFGRNRDVSQWLDEDSQVLFNEIASLQFNASIQALLKGSVFSSWGIKSVNDFLPQVLAPSIQRPSDDDLPATFQHSPLLDVGKKLVLYHAAHTTKELSHRPDDYRALRKSSNDNVGLRDLDLHSITDEDPGMSEWRELALKYYGSGIANKRVAHQAIKAFLQHFLAHPKLPRDPGAYLDKKNPPTPMHVASEARRNNALILFIDWVIASKYTIADEETGDPVVLPWVSNPFTWQTRDRTKVAQTARDPMPLLLVEKALAILTANDWAWAKAQYGGGQTADGDWYKRFDPIQKEWKIVWSPVRAIALYVRLTTVFRTFQIRHFDSGETDNLRVELVDREHQIFQTTPNTHPLAGKNRRKPIARGVVQTYLDEQIGQLTPFLRINTNKTADQNKEAWEKGYDCPWAPIEVIEKLLWLRDWQAENHPVSTPVNWKDIPELRSIHTDDALHGMSGTFLFRDPAGREPKHPITHGRIQTLWALLNEEVEKQLANEGFISDVANQSFTLITNRTKEGYPSATYYDMHSLRVTMISALYKRGLPVKIIMLIAGHATVPMSLYYTKFSMTEIKDVIRQVGHQATDIEKQKEWATALKEKQLVDVKPLLAYNDEDALTAFAATNQGLVFMDCGICTAGCAKCHIGIKVQKTKKEVFYLPVPGGRKNCVSCRFLISGPPFMHGLNATINVKSLAAQQIAVQRSHAEKQKARLENERREAHESGIRFTKFDELKKAAEDFDRLTGEIDQTFDEMGAASGLLAHCVSVHNKLIEEGTPDDQKLALITRDMSTIKQQFEESTEFDLIDRVCQDSVFFETIKGNTVDSANLKRTRYYDRMLQRHGLPAAFLALDDQTALEAGNALSRLLRSRIGKKGTLELMEGLKKLEEFKILPETIYQEIENATGRSLAIERISTLPMLENNN